MREFNVIIERDAEGYLVASVPSLPGCHTQARSLDELMERVREAVELCLEGEGEEAEGLEFVGVQRLAVAGRAGLAVSPARSSSTCWRRLASSPSESGEASTSSATRTADGPSCPSTRERPSVPA